MCGLDTCCSFLAEFFRSEQWYIFCCPLVFRDAFRRNDGQSVQCADSFIDWKPHFTYNYKQARPFHPLNRKKASLFHHLKQRIILLFWTSLTATTEYCQYCRSIFLWEIWSHKKIPRKTKHLPMKLFLWKLFSIRQNSNVLEKLTESCQIMITMPPHQYIQHHHGHFFYWPIKKISSWPLEWGIPWWRENRMQTMQLQQPIPFAIRCQLKISNIAKGQ